MPRGKGCTQTPNEGYLFDFVLGLEAELPRQPGFTDLLRFGGMQTLAGHCRKAREESTDVTDSLNEVQILYS